MVASLRALWRISTIVCIALALAAPVAAHGETGDRADATANAPDAPFNRSRSLAVPQPPVGTVAISPATIQRGGNSTLTITLSNPNQTDPLNNVVFVVNVPAGLTLGARTSNGSCSSFVSRDRVRIDIVSSLISANVTCTITFAVTASSPGIYTVTGSAPESQGFGLIIGTTPEPATLTVVASEPTFMELDSDRNPQRVGEPVLLTAAVYQEEDEDAPISGAVSFTMGGQPIGGCTDLAITRAATCTLPGQPAGNVEIAATFTPAENSGLEGTSDTLTVSFVAAPSDQSFVSGVGDDANDCSRTAPCQTFARALAMTNAGGTINCLDPGGFGTVTIDRSVTISCRGRPAGIIASGENAITIAAPADAVVTLDGLSLQGLRGSGVAQGQNGIAFVSGGTLIVSNTTVHGFGGWGIAFTPNGNAALTLDRVTLTGNGSANVADSGGVLVRPAGAIRMRVSVEHGRVSGNTIGFRADSAAASGATIAASLADTTLTGNSVAGLHVRSGSSSIARVAVVRGVIAGNGYGVLTNGAAAQTMIRSSTITGNATGLFAKAGGQNVSGGRNRVQGNRADGSFTATQPAR